MAAHLHLTPFCSGQGDGQPVPAGNGRIHLLFCVHPDIKKRRVRQHITADTSNGLPAPDLARVPGDFRHRDPGKYPAQLFHIPLLNIPPALQERIACSGGNDPVDEHAVRLIPVKAQIHIASLGLLHHHLFRGAYQAHAAGVLVL